jgi:PGF-CTERM protein
MIRRLLGSTRGGSPDGSFTALLALVLVGSLVLGAATAPVAAQQGLSTDRAISDGTLAPGETATVTVEITSPESANLTVVEEFSPTFASVEIVDDDGADFSAVRNANNELFATYGDRESATLTYEVTVAESAEDDASYQFDGYTEHGDAQTSIGGDSEIAVQQQEDGLNPELVRSIDETTLAPGESTTVTVEVEQDESAEFTLIEQFDPAPESVEIVQAGSSQFSGVNDANDELFATYGDRTQAVLRYEVTVAEDAEGGTTYDISGFGNYTGAQTQYSIEGDSSLTVEAANTGGGGGGGGGGAADATDTDTATDAPDTETPTPESTTTDEPASDDDESASDGDESAEDDASAGSDDGDSTTTDTASANGDADAGTDGADDTADGGATTSTTSTEFPGFGVTVALVALTMSALALARRR